MIIAKPLVPEIERPMRNQPRAERRASDRIWAHGRLLAASVCTALLFGSLVPQTASAQSVDDQIQRLQRELSDLQRQVYGGETPPAGASSGGGVAPTQAARIELRLNQFEDQLRDLTGRVEEMQFQADSVASRLDRLVADVDLRLQQLEQGAPPPLAAAGDPGSPSGDPGASQQGLVPSSPAATTSPAAPQTLGTIPETDLQNFQRQQGNVAANPPAAAAPSTPAAGQALAAVPAGTPREQYDQAFALLRQANYQGAEEALSTFLVQHPNDPLAGNAKYWLGETYYVRGDYQSAAVTFAEGFEAYPDNPKAPDNLLKLGMSLASLGSKDDACGTFEVLQQRYADASATIIQRARQESQRIGC